MNIHLFAKNAFWLSLASVSSFLLSVVSFILFMNFFESFLLIMMAGFVVVAIALSITSIVFASKGKKQIRLNPNEYDGLGKCSAAIVISIVNIVLNVAYILLIIFILYIVANLFR